ncbi:MAG: hypothetical protein IJ131_10305, partial [Eggerthellaceae bacterium]|nr:hypothetical protein [Eggerthellaceae bacterium]
WELVGDNAGLEYSHDPGLNVGTEFMFEEVGMERVPRCHWFTKNADDPFCTDPTKLTYPTSGGTGLWKTIGAALEERNIETLLETPIKSLVVAEDSNEVLGVCCLHEGKDYYIKARKGVMMAMGNWASNHEMFSNFTGNDYVPGGGGGIGLDLEDDNDGAGIKAGLAIGADIVFPSLVGHNHDTPDGASFGCGGFRVDTKMHVIDIFGQAIPRLFAGGAAAGGVIVKNYPVCGASVGRGLYFGRVAGQELAKLDAWQ